MNDWLIGFAAAVAALVAALAPLSGAFKAWLEFKAGQKTGQALTNEAARSIPAAALQDTMALAALTDAVLDVGKAIREGTKAEADAEKDRLSLALEQLVDRLDGDARRAEGGRRLLR